MLKIFIYILIILIHFLLFINFLFYEYNINFKIIKLYSLKIIISNYSILVNLKNKYNKKNK